MRIVVISALTGGAIGALLCGVVGADFNSGLAPAEMKRQQALEGAVLWAVAGFVVGALFGAAIGGIARAVRGDRTDSS
jgi:uncharacterized protein YcfJ